MEIRQNKLTRDWIIFSPERANRPKDFMKALKNKEIKEYDKNCPFCNINEEVILETPGIGNNPWQTKVLLNKYPALVPDKNTEREIDGIFLKMAAYGKHEVVIEHPRHNMCIGRMKTEEVKTVLETYKIRYNELMKDERNMMVLIFQNHGSRAGASLIHPHSQIIATGMVPLLLRVNEEEAQQYFDNLGRCVMCDIVKFEESNRNRIILENDKFLSFVPYAAEVPYEVWIVPKNHKASFGNIGSKEISEFASILQNIMKRLYEKLNDPDYNYIVISATRYKAGEPHLHWYLRIRPRLITRAGFEIGSGISINPSLPEKDAEYLRG
jgi:UDPglucose--hexose-1-phosphate uridylyltransferase